MLNLTDKATEMMAEALKMEEKADHGLRIVAQTGCCSGPAYGLYPEEESSPNDTVITEGDLKIFIDPASMSLLEGATIDFVSDPELGQGFSINNPNYVAPEGNGGGCACGGGEGEAQASEGESQCACGGNGGGVKNSEGECSCGGNCQCKS
jgi:iron-sulfur cluster assembly accessory protein